MEPFEAPGAEKLIPVSILTGFLGSGKTTVLNHLVRHPAMSRALVIINEFGDIGLDHDLITSGHEDSVVEMSSGCLCCTIRGDLVQTLRDSFWRYSRNGERWFDRVMIETTGLADPAPILHTLMTGRTIVERFRLDSVIATVDASNGADTLDRQVESVKQAAVADRLLLTKTDLASPEQVAALEARLRTLNPAAPLLRPLNGEVDPAALLDAGLYNPETKSLDVQNWLKAEAYEASHMEGHHHDHDHDADHHHGHDHAHDVNRHDDHIRAVCVTMDEPLNVDAFEGWLQAILLLKGPDVLRIKGIVNIAGLDRPLVIHGVQHIFHPPVMLDAWPSEDRRSRIVFITRDIDEGMLRDIFNMFNDSTTQLSQGGF